MATVDITIRGGGIFGLSVAWSCLKYGAKVRVIEKRHIGAGASGGIVGALAPHVPENWNPKKQFQLESLLRAETWWSEVAEASGQNPGYARLGRIQPIPDERAVALAQARVSGAVKLWQDHAIWEVIKSAKGWALPSTTGLYIYDTLSARIHPRNAVDALAQAIRARGGEIVEGDGPGDEGAVVHATGWEGLTELSTKMAHPAGNGVKGQAALFKHDARHLPQIFVDGVHVIPHSDGTTAVGSTSERDFMDAKSTDKQLDDLVAKARTTIPELTDAEVLVNWAGVRPRARSRAPMLGAWPGRPGHFIANGGFKIGFGMAPKVGETLALLILDGDDTIPEGFRVEDNL